jgi:hypothetical protein
VLANPPAPFPSRPPVWATALVHGSIKNITVFDAAFAAGAALAALDVVVRKDSACAGAWRRRLALRAAAASLQTRAGDEAALRDALALTRPGGDPGPAGRVYLAWRALAAARPPRLADIAVGLGAAPGDLPLLSATLDAHTRSLAPAPLAAAAAAAAVAAKWPRATRLAFAVADLVLAARLRWRVAVPLVALEVQRVRAGEGDWTAVCCAAYARAATRACDLHDELSVAAARLEAVAPKLRAKGAGAVISALLDADAVSGVAKVAGMSDRGLRRLFDRLVELGAVRELTGRATFRLYGL